MNDEVIVYNIVLCQELIVPLQSFISLTYPKIYVSIVKTINANKLETRIYKSWS